MRIPLVEIGCLIAGVQSTQRYAIASSRGWRTRPTDTPANAPYKPLLVGCSFRSRSSTGENDGEIRMGEGEIVIQNANRALDGILDYAYDGQTARLLVVEHTDPYSAIEEISRWVVEQPSATDPNITFHIRTPTYGLDRSIQTERYGGTGGVDGTADLTGKPRPLPWGVVFNGFAVLVDPTRNIYELGCSHDLVTLIGIPSDATSVNIKQEGQSTTRQADYTSVADMLANAPTGGNCRICNASASGVTYNYGIYVRFDGDPDGDVTFDGVFTPTVFAAQTADMLAALVAVATGGNGHIPTPDSAAVSVAFPYYVTLAFGSAGEPATYLDALRPVTRGMRGWIFPCQGVPTQYPANGFDPPMGARWLVDPSTLTPSPYRNSLIDPTGTVGPELVIDGAQVALNGFSRAAPYDFGWPEHRVTLLYDRNHHMMTAGFAGTVTPAERQRLALEYLSASDNDPSVLTTYPTAVDRTIATAWAYSPSTDLTIEAARQLAAFSAPHPTYTLKAKADLYHAALSIPGDPCTVENYRRFGCDVSRQFQILEIGIDFLSLDVDGRVDVTLTLRG